MRCSGNTAAELPTWPWATADWMDRTFMSPTLDTERAHEDTQVLGGVGDLGAGLVGLVDPVDGGVAGPGHLGDAVGDPLRAGGDLGDAARHLRGGGGLLLHGAGDGGLVVVDRGDHLADPVDHLDGAAG